MTARVHFDISDDANWRSACGTMPSEGGTNLSLADYQVTCRKCLALMGYSIAAAEAPLTECLPDPLRRAA
jgi:DNA/RNA endonuclease G (NUC1)